MPPRTRKAKKKESPAKTTTIDDMVANIDPSALSAVAALMQQHQNNTADSTKVQPPSSPTYLPGEKYEYEPKTPDYAPSPILYDPELAPVTYSHDDDSVASVTWNPIPDVEPPQQQTWNPIPEHAPPQEQRWNPLPDPQQMAQQSWTAPPPAYQPPVHASRQAQIQYPPPPQQPQYNDGGHNKRTRWDNDGGNTRRDYNGGGYQNNNGYSNGYQNNNNGGYQNNNDRQSQPRNNNRRNNNNREGGYKKLEREIDALYQDVELLKAERESHAFRIASLERKIEQLVVAQGRKK